MKSTLRYFLISPDSWGTYLCTWHDKCNICSRYCIYHVKFTSYCELIECSRPIRFFIVSLMYNNKVQMEISGEACLFYFWFSFILVWTIRVNWVYEFTNAYLVTQKFYTINCLRMSIKYMCQTCFTDRDTLLVHDSCKRPPKPSIHITLIRSTPAITLSLTYCHLVSYRGWSNPGFLDTHQLPTNRWYFGWSL